MNRREIMALLGGAAVWPVAARAQQPMPMVGFLNSASAWESADQVAAFRQGLGETGYFEGRNVLIEFRWAEGHYERLPSMAADLARRGVSVLAAMGTPSLLPAKTATSTIPIVFRIGVDPVELGLVASMNRPGGNLTGVVSLNVELEPKRLELLREVAPDAKLIGLLLNPTSPNAETQSRDLQLAAGILGLQLHVLNVSSERDFDQAFATLAQLRAGALIVASDPFFTTRSEQLVALELRYSIPAIHSYRQYAVAGGLMSYGGSLADSYRLPGVYTGRILKGEKAGDLPVQQATKVELIINLKTAKSLGLTVPLALLTRADEVIE
jgi:putative ABC transport system substrate-binding protein